MRAIHPRTTWEWGEDGTPQTIPDSHIAAVAQWNGKVTREEPAEPRQHVNNGHVHRLNLAHSAGHSKLYSYACPLSSLITPYHWLPFLATPGSLAVVDKHSESSPTEKNYERDNGRASDQGHSITVPTGYITVGVC